MSLHDHAPPAAPSLPPARHRPRPMPKPVDEQTAQAKSMPAAAPAKSDYEVGYRKPPKHSRFKPGQSGNPKGRPKGSKNFTTVVREILDERVAVNTPTGPRKLPRIEILLRKLVEMSAKGNMRAMQEVLRQYAQAYAAEAVEAAVEASTPTDFTEADAASFALLRELLLSGELGESSGGAS